ncbi:hypothetical protein A9Q91_03000 [Candidatus Gracilibacteria bacterium 28_42_T64]|nr:hypothetical protein A9Q91_03000 [Candidatus Gracilibacteria bacterium 28_42_T64]
MKIGLIVCIIVLAIVSFDNYHIRVKLSNQVSMTNQVRFHFDHYNDGISAIVSAYNEKCQIPTDTVLELSLSKLSGKEKSYPAVTHIMNKLSESIGAVSSNG